MFLPLYIILLPAAPFASFTTLIFPSPSRIPLILGTVSLSLSFVRHLSHCLFLQIPLQNKFLLEDISELTNQRNLIDKKIGSNTDKKYVKQNNNYDLLSVEKNTFPQKQDPRSTIHSVPHAQ